MSDAPTIEDLFPPRKLRVAVYTSIMGDYCPLLEPEEPCADVSMTCLSDIWRGHTAWRCAWDRGDPSLTPRMRAKYHKMHPPVGADFTIWVDASLRLKNVRRFVDFCLGSLGNSSLALFAHPQHGSIYEEAEASLSHHVHKYAGLPVLEQAEHYRAYGLPDNHRLYAGGVVVRRSSAPWIDDFNRSWWEECRVWTPQDQISLPYVLYSLGRTPAVIPGSVYSGLDWEWQRGPDR